MLKLINPYYRAPSQVTAQQHAPTVDAWLKTQTTNRLISVAELKAAIPAIAPDLDRAVMNNIAALLRCEFENPGDTIV